MEAYTIAITVNGFGQCGVAIAGERGTWQLLFTLCQTEAMLREIARQAADSRCVDMTWHRAALLSNLIRYTRDNTEILRKDASE